MSYTPPLGSAGNISWKPSQVYTAAGGDEASITWHPSSLYTPPHGNSVDVSWVGEAEYITVPGDDTSVSFLNSQGGYSPRYGDDVRLNLVKLFSDAPVITGDPLDLLFMGDNIPIDGSSVNVVLGHYEGEPPPLVLILGEEYAVTTSTPVIASGSFRLEGSTVVAQISPMVAHGSFRLTGHGSLNFYGASIAPEFGNGQSVESTLFTQVLFAIPNAGGESVAVTMSSTIGVPVNWWSGESVSAVLQRRTLIDPAFPSFGQSLDVVLTIQSTQMALETGESLSVSLYVYDLIATTAADGATLGVSLSTSATIPIAFSTGESHTSAVEFHATSYPSVAYSTGESFTTALDWHATSYPEVTFGTGESLSSELYVKRTALLTIWMAAGESFDSAMGLPSRADIAINMWTGSTFAVPTVSAAPQLGALSMATGESSSFTLGEQENYRIYPGESMEFTLTWSPSVSHTYSTGENCAVILDTRPGEPFRIQMWNGENFGAINMSIQVATQLSVTFRTGVWIESSFDDATTSYDLELPCCGPEVGKLPGESEIFELEGELPSYVRLPEVKLLFTCELSARPRFQMAFGTGEAFTTVERNIDFVDLEPIQQGGFWVTGDWLDVTPNHNLCYPNFIPDGDAIVVELEYEDEGCYADYAHTGESFSAVLRTIQSLPVGTNYTGESMWFDLNTRNPYMWFRFEVGEHLWQGNFPANPQVNMGHGERMSFTFETPSYLFGCSESMEVSLTLTYDVEFMEVGCLDNEYKYQNEYGDEDFSKFNAVAVELEPFFHQIKARCY